MWRRLCYVLYSDGEAGQIGNCGMLEARGREGDVYKKMKAASQVVSEDAANGLRKKQKWHTSRLQLCGFIQACCSSWNVNVKFYLQVSGGEKLWMQLCSLM